MNRINILKTKLLFPRLFDTIKRDRLQPLLKEIPLKKLIMVTGGAGFGKTTLIAQTLLSMDFQFVWYRLDSTDGDFSTFISYLIAGIQEYYGSLVFPVVIRMMEKSILSKYYQKTIFIIFFFF